MLQIVQRQRFEELLDGHGSSCYQILLVDTFAGIPTISRIAIIRLTLTVRRIQSVIAETEGLCQVAGAFAIVSAPSQPVA